MATAAMTIPRTTPKPFSRTPPPGGFGNTVAFRVFFQSGNDINYRAT
jgi:hypothetical protein